MLLKFKKIICLIISFVLFTFSPIVKYNNILAYADNSAVYNNPLLMPLTAWMGAVAVGSGIIGKNAAEATTQLIQNAANNLKEKELEKINNDDTYDSPFRVIQGGSNKTPQKPNNNNKNGAWFALGAASSLGSAMLFEKGATETAMQTLNDLKAYQQSYADLGLLDASSMLNQSSASNISLQLANIDNKLVKQWDAFLHSTWVTNNLGDYDDYYYNVNFRYSNLTNANTSYPTLRVNCFQKKEGISKIRVSLNPFSYRTVSGPSGTYNIYWVSNSNPACKILNDDGVNLSAKYFDVQVSPRSSLDTPVTVGKVDDRLNNSDFLVAPQSVSYLDQWGYVGYKWLYENPWGLTNNTYNYNQTFNVNFPDWNQGLMEILGQQLQGVNIGGITSPINQPNFDPTQSQIQTGTVPQNVITQYINNYQNPESIPDDELNPDPDPDPDPDPEPNPQPDPEPIPDENFLNGFMLPNLITNKFPFCIPFDVARALTLFDTNERVAPKWECDLHYGSNVYHLVIDLSQFNDIATFARNLEFILFIVGLAVGTRSLIRG